MLPRNRLNFATNPMRFVGRCCLLLLCVLAGVTGDEASAQAAENDGTIQAESEPSAGDPPLREFTLEELRKYDGSDVDLPVLLALKGTVFDVTSGKKFYYPGKPYAHFAGRDVTRNTAMFNKDPSTLDRTDFPKKREIYLNKVFEGTYKRKYPVVGFIHNPTQPPPGWVEPADEEEVEEDASSQKGGRQQDESGSIAKWLQSAWTALTGSKPEL